MTRYRYFLVSSVLQFPYSFNVQQYRFFFAPPKPSALPLHRKSCRRPCMVNCWTICCFTHLILSLTVKEYYLENRPLFREVTDKTMVAPFLNWRCSETCNSINWPANQSSAFPAGALGFTLIAALDYWWAISRVRRTYGPPRDQWVTPWITECHWQIIPEGLLKSRLSLFCCWSETEVRVT